MAETEAEGTWGFERQKICSNSGKRAYHCPSRGVVREIPVCANQSRPTVECRHNREASMKALIAGLWLALMMAAGTSAAQLAPFNEVGVTMGHWHFASRDVQANKKIFVAMGGTPIPGGNETVSFPGIRINLTLGDVPGSGESVGSVVNHVGFIVKNVQEQVAKWKANGVPVLPGTNNRLDQAFVVTPDGVRIEILEDKTQTMPIRNEHVHF